MKEIWMNSTHAYAVYELCKERNWFTCGSSSQYDKMFDLINKEVSCHTIALVIWLCSDDVPLAEITDALLEIVNR